MKAVVDVYNGSVQLFVMDPKDPVLSVYRKAFPAAFKDLADMPSDLKKHLRYPEDLFTIQADLYRTYHMTAPQVFYNQEDLWDFPQEKYAGSAIQVAGRIERHTTGVQAVPVKESHRAVLDFNLDTREVPPVVETQ